MWNIFFYVSLHTSNNYSQYQIKLFKTISIKYSIKQNITIFRSISHGFVNFLTAEMVNDPNDTHHNQPNLALKSSTSLPMTHVIDNPLDDFSNSDDQTNHIITPTGNTPPPPLFYTNRPSKFNNMARFKLIPKRKQNLHSKTYQKTSSLHSSQVQTPTLPYYSTVKTTPKDNSLDNTSANNDNDSPVKVYSKTNSTIF